MNSQERDFGQRRSFRSGLPAGQQEALLEVGRRRFAVRLLDESVEGAAVWTGRDVGVKADDVVRLTTTFGRFEARVVRVAQIEPAETDGSREKPLFRLGLERLPELETFSTARPSLPEPARSPAPCPPGGI